MDFVEKQYQCWDLQTRDTDAVKALLDTAGKYEALEMKQAFGDGFNGWWYGAYLDAQMVSAAYITPQYVYLYGTDREGMVGMGKSLGRAQGKRSSGSTHSLFGPSDMVQAFWHGFQRTGKSVIDDIQLSLLELTEIGCKLNDAYMVRQAVKKDLLLVIDFLGEALIEVLGMDVRRVSKEAHEKYCLQQIESGSILLGYHRGKPAYITRFIETPVGIFLENSHFPTAMHRPKVIRGINARVGEFLLQKSASILIYHDTKDEDEQTALDEVGYRFVNASRLMRIR